MVQHNPWLIWDGMTLKQNYSKYTIEINLLEEMYQIWKSQLLYYSNTSFLLTNIKNRFQCFTGVFNTTWTENGLPTSKLLVFLAVETYMYSLAQIGIYTFNQ